VRVEADGYLPATSESLARDLTGTLELKLTRRTAAHEISGVVRLPDRQPAAGAEVALCTFEHWVAAWIGDARFVRPHDATVVRTDADGQYSFAPNHEAHTLIAVHAAGFARVRIKPGTGPDDIVLQAWGRIEGTVLADGLAANEWTAILTDWASGQYRGGLGLDKKFYNSPLDADGRFVMERVPPGNFYVCLERGLNNRPILQTPVSVPAGQTVRVQVGGMGRLLVGRLDAGEVKGVTNWQQQATSAILFPAVRTPRPTPTGLSQDAMKNWEVDFWQSEAGHNALFTGRGFTLDIAPDGAFTAYDVLPGAYNLYLHVRQSVLGVSANIGDVSEKVVVPENSRAIAQTVDLGTLFCGRRKNEKRNR
jgi:hypothetical protein